MQGNGPSRCARQLDAEPLAVWASRTWHSWERWREAQDWAEPRFGDLTIIYRAEIFLIDVPFAVLHRYAVDDQGHPFMDPQRPDEAARDEPATLMLDALPPKHLLGAH